MICEHIDTSARGQLPDQGWAALARPRHSLGRNKGGGDGHPRGVSLANTTKQKSGAKNASKDADRHTVQPGDSVEYKQESRSFITRDSHAGR